MPLSPDELDGAMCDLMNAMEIIRSEYTSVIDTSDIDRIVILNDQLDEIMRAVDNITELLDSIIHNAIKDGADRPVLVKDSQNDHI